MLTKIAVADVTKQRVGYPPTGVDHRPLTGNYVTIREPKPPIEATSSGLPVQARYGPEDLEARSLDYTKDLGEPGSFPFTRGIHPSMYRERLWTIRQVTGYSTPVETNERLRFLTEQGETGLSIVFDQPTHFHFDSDHPLARGEVGKVGVPWDTLKDVEDTMAGIDPASISMSLIANSGWVFLPFYLAAARKRGVPFDQLSGTLQNDPILVFHSVGTFTVPLVGGMKLLTDVAEYCVKHVPRWNFVSVAGYNTREAGANAVQEAAISLASALAYARSFEERDLDPDAFLPRISFFLSAHNDFFEEIAKYRAMRRIWARMCREELGARKERSMLMRFHTQTAGSTLTQQQPVNNVVRTSLQALAAVLGGTQSLHTNSFDEAVALPTEEAVTLAIRTQQIIAYESRVPSVVDPLGGSYFIESLTSDMEHAILEMLDEIAAQGGIVSAAQSGWIQQIKFEESDRYFDEIESGKRPVVGVTAFASDDEAEIPVFKIDPEYETHQIERLNQWREKRDQAATDEALEALESVATGGGNVIEPTIDAVTAGATIGEIGGLFKKVYGEQREPNERVLLS